MTRFEKVWDFLFGVALISGAPLAAFWFVSVLASYFVSASSRDYVARLAVATMCAQAASVISFALAIWWRSQHRLLPRSLFGVEVAVALLVGGIYFIVIAVVGYATHRAD